MDPATPTAPISLRTQAETFAIALEIGAVSVGSVIAWAESASPAESAPCASLCKVALMAGSYPLEVAAALRELPGEFDLAVANQGVLLLLGYTLSQNRARADQVAAALYRLAISDELWDDELRSIAYWADDALTLADQGQIPQSRDQVIDKLIRALAKLSSRSPLPQ